MYNTDKLKYQLAKIPYATIYNLQPWTNTSSKDLKSSLQWPDKLIKKLCASGEIRKMYCYPPYNKEMIWRHKTFYSVHSSLKNGVNCVPKEMARSKQDHESALVDIFLAFLNLYPGYDIDIKWNVKLPYDDNKNYQPDAIIKMTDLDLNEYNFIVELERTKTYMQIRKIKFFINNRLNKFTSYGLSKNTRFLYVYTHQLYNIYWRPIEYDEPLPSKYIKSVDKHILTLIKKNQDVIDGKYLFLPFHDFYQLNKAVWYNCQGKKVCLINK